MWLVGGRIARAKMERQIEIAAVRPQNFQGLCGRLLITALGKPGFDDLEQKKS
jgi:hypothetical protein